MPFAYWKSFLKFICRVSHILYLPTDFLLIKPFLNSLRLSRSLVRLRPSYFSKNTLFLGLCTCSYITPGDLLHLVVLFSEKLWLICVFRWCQSEAFFIKFPINLSPNGFKGHQWSLPSSTFSLGVAKCGFSKCSIS